LFNNGVILEGKSNKRLFPSSSPPRRCSRITRAAKRKQARTPPDTKKPMPEARVLLAIILSTSLLFLAASAQQRSQWKKPNTQQHETSRFNPARSNAPVNANITTTTTTPPNKRFLAQRHHLSVRREFLHAHNNVRRHFNEPILKWSRKLARYARRWANKRFLDCQMIHSYGPYGENLFWGKYDHWTATEAVQSWIREHRYYNPHTNECAPGQMCGHYTQIVWRDTSRIGCARKKCLNGGLFVICVYDPPGNYINESPFGTAAPSG
jgi:uncharacterized protein YkwD